MVFSHRESALVGKVLVKSENDRAVRHGPLIDFMVTFSFQSYLGGMKNIPGRFLAA